MKQFIVAKIQLKNQCGAEVYYAIVAVTGSAIENFIPDCKITAGGYVRALGR